MKIVQVRLGWTTNDPDETHQQSYHPSFALGKTRRGCVKSNVPVRELKQSPKGLRQLFGLSFVAETKLW